MKLQNAIDILDRIVGFESSDTAAGQAWTTVKYALKEHQKDNVDRVDIEIDGDETCMINKPIGIEINFKYNDGYAVTYAAGLSIQNGEKKLPS